MLFAQSMGSVNRLRQLLAPPSMTRFTSPASLQSVRLCRCEGRIAPGTRTGARWQEGASEGKGGCQAQVQDRTGRRRLIVQGNGAGRDGG